MLRLARCRRAFTLIELISVVAIIGLLAALLLPVVGRISDNADTTKCMSNLRQVGIAVNLYAGEHDNIYPRIETDPTNPVYSPDKEARPLAEVLKSYGITPAVVTCPADLKAKLNYTGDQQNGTSFFAQKGSSYEWRPLFDEEPVNAPKIYTPRGAFALPMNRIRLLADFVNAGEAPHQRAPGVSSSYNTLYADGTVRTLVVPKVNPTK